jgi:hypothetical protein
MKSQRELSIIGACGGYSKTSAKHAPVVGNSVLNLLINILGSGSELVDRYVPKDTAPREICDIELTPLVQLNYLPSSYISTIISPY